MLSIKKIVAFLILAVVWMTPLQAHESESLNLLLTELETVIENQERLLNEQQTDNDELVRLSTEQTGELATLKTETTELKKSAGEQQTEIERLLNSEIEREKFWLKYERDSIELIDDLRADNLRLESELARAKLIRNISIGLNIGEGILLWNASKR